MNTVTKVFTITATPDTMLRFERFLAFFHWNGGHSGIFAMSFDGDGHERMKVDPEPPRSLNADGFSAVGRIAGCGDVEIAGETYYDACSFDRSHSRYRVMDGFLYRIAPDDRWYRKETDSFRWVEVPNPYQSEQ